MIAKDEEHFLPATLESVKDLFFEFIFVDTGSTDNTMKIAAQYGAKIIEEPWEDDFSKHRNTSLDAATGDWILVLDADEIIHESQVELVRKLTMKEKCCFLFVQRHYTNDQRLSSFQPCTGEHPELEKNYIGFFESSLCRLFPNDSRIRYRNPVHELVEPVIAEIPEFTIVQSPVRLHHYGHTPEAKAKKNKTKLYTPLGQKKTALQPDTWKAYYELGVEHNCNGRPEESVHAFQKAVQLNPEYVPTWVNFGYVLTELGHLKEGFQALSEALKREPNNPEAHCNIAVNYMREKNFVMAEAHLKRAIKVKPDYLNAYSNLGAALMSMRRVSEAALVFQEGYRRAPTNSQLLLRFGFSLLQVGILDEAKTVLERVIKLAPKDPAGWQAMALTLERLRLPKEAELAHQKVKELTQAARQ